MMDQIRISGTTDASSRQDAEAFLRLLTDIEPSRSFPSDMSERRAIGAGDIIAWVLAIPGAITALVEIKRQLSSLPKRKELRRRIEPTFERLTNEPSLELEIGGEKINFGQATLDDVLDALARAEIEQKQRDVSK